MLEKRLVWRNAKERLTQGEEAHEVCHPIGLKMVELGSEVCEDIAEEGTDWQRQILIEKQSENHPLVGSRGRLLLAGLRQPPVGLRDLAVMNVPLHDPLGYQGRHPVTSLPLVGGRSNGLGGG